MNTDPTSGNAPPSLPRLAVISDVAVERTLSGSLILYRLLRDYPVDRLFICDTDVRPAADSEFRLSDVPTRRIHYQRPRWARTRWNPLGVTMMANRMKQFDSILDQTLDAFDPEAVLTVTHDYFWIAAARYADRHGIPLHVIVHDDWETQMLRRRGWTVPMVRATIRPLLASVYRQAETRFCVSPAMVTEYADRFGCQGSVLYPNRGADSPDAKVRYRPLASGQSPSIAFAGSLHTCGVWDLLRKMAEAMGQLGGTLDLYTQSPQAKLNEIGLGMRNVRLMGFDPAGVPADRIASQSQALFLPASFAPAERVDTTTLFPSKLTDYTAIGLPILVWGPPYSSAVGWGRDNPEGAITVSDPDMKKAKSAMEYLLNHPDAAERMAGHAVQSGNRDFDAKSAIQVFHAAIGMKG